MVLMVRHAHRPHCGDEKRIRRSPNAWLQSGTRHPWAGFIGASFFSHAALFASASVLPDPLAEHPPVAPLAVSLVEIPSEPQAPSAPPPPLESQPLPAARVEPSVPPKVAPLLAPPSAVRETPTPEQSQPLPDVMVASTDSSSATSGTLGGVPGGVPGLGNGLPSAQGPRVPGRAGTARPPPPPPKPPEMVFRNEADVRRRRIQGSDPRYPRKAEREGIEGVLVAKVVIGRDGRVTGISLLQNHPAFERAVRAAISGWRFAPYRVEGSAVSVSTVFRFTFRLGG